MLESLINSLDQRGILVMQTLLGRRCIELLEAETKEDKPKSSLVLPNTELIKG